METKKVEKVTFLIANLNEVIVKLQCQVFGTDLRKYMWPILLIVLSQQRALTTCIVSDSP